MTRSLYPFLFPAQPAVVIPLRAANGPRAAAHCRTMVVRRQFHRDVAQGPTTFLVVGP